MKNREYSTKNIDRILRQANGLVANKRGNNSVLAFDISYNMRNPVEDTISIVIHEDDVLSFDDYLRQAFENEVYNDEEDDINDKAFIRYAKEQFDETWYYDAEQFISERFGRIINEMNSQLEYFNIIAYIDDHTSENILIIEPQAKRGRQNINLDKMENEQIRINRMLTAIAKKYQLEIDEND